MKTHFGQQPAVPPKSCLYDALPCIESVHQFGTPWLFLAPLRVVELMTARSASGRKSVRDSAAVILLRVNSLARLLRPWVQTKAGIRRRIGLPTQERP